MALPGVFPCFSLAGCLGALQTDHHRLCLGASYREDVGATRYSGAEIVIHDPYVKHWWELEKQDTYPAPGHSWARFFHNQEKLLAYFYEAVPKLNFDDIELAVFVTKINDDPHPFIFARKKV